jgi:hypothetical protein
MNKNKAFDIAIQAGYKVAYLERVWRYCDDDPEVLLIALDLNKQTKRKITMKRNDKMCGGEA